MKVLITGVFSTGKTTLWNELRRRLERQTMTVSALPDVARQCPFVLNENQEESASIWMVCTQIANELGAQGQNPKYLLCDRGVPDIAAHQLHSWAKYRQAARPEVETLLRAWTSSYDLILQSDIDPELPIEADSIRSTDEMYRLELNHLHAKFLETAENVHVLPHALKDRIECVSRLLGEEL